MTLFGDWISCCDCSGGPSRIADACGRGVKNRKQRLSEGSKMFASMGISGVNDEPNGNTIIITGGSGIGRG
jgi:hypothetical protein